MGSQRRAFLRKLLPTLVVSCGAALACSSPSTSGGGAGGPLTGTPPPTAGNPSMGGAGGTAAGGVANVGSAGTASSGASGGLASIPAASGSSTGGVDQGGSAAAASSVGGSHDGSGGGELAGSASGGADGGSPASGGNGGAAEPANPNVPSTGIAILGRGLYVDGRPFHLRGVNWNPVPRGGVHPENLDYDGFASTDIPLMEAAGINAVRTYEPLLDGDVLDQLEDAGIYVLNTVYPYGGDAASVVVDRVNQVKDHPAILMWVIGNEWNYNGLYVDLPLAEARARLNEVASLVKQNDTTHPLATIYGEYGEIEASLAGMPDIDVWGINAYRGISFGDLFDRWEALSDKPMFLGEYGADAFNANSAVNAYDPESQREATFALTSELLDHSVALHEGVTLGGLVFEWADEWWKAQGGSNDAQDNGGIAPGGGPYPDQTFNEEWWGLVDIDREPRPAYDALAELYADPDNLP